MEIKRTEVTHILHDAQLWVREVLDDGTYHRRVVEPGADADTERDPGVAAKIRELHTSEVVERFRAAREAAKLREVSLDGR